MNRLLLLIGLMLLYIGSGCGHASEKEENTSEARFQVTRPVRKDTVLTTEYVCQIRSIRNIELRALEKGYLEHIYVDEGQFVKKGHKSQLQFGQCAAKTGNYSL